MKAPRLGRVFFLLVLGVSLLCIPWASSQTRPGPRGNGSITGRVPDSSNPPGTMVTTAFISGKVTLDDGGELTEPAAVQTVCRGERHTRTYTDHHGGFSFELGDPSENSTGDLSDASNAMITRASLQRDERNWRDCQIQAVLGGFTSEVIDLASRMNTLESTDVGRIVMHRMEHVEGTSVSVTSAQAPSGARKAFEKGRDAEQKKNWNRALTALQKAVQIYPKYAAAWFELGRVQMMKNDATAAKLSFQQALAADAKYVPPYQGLAEMAFRSKQWPEVVQITDRMLALNPISFPVAYFYSAVANYNLLKVEAAEKSARQGVKVDSQHQIPQLRYSLGIILLKKQDYEQASYYFRQFMQLTTETAELEAANRQLAEIAKLASGGSSDNADPKR